MKKINVLFVLCSICLLLGMVWWHLNQREHLLCQQISSMKNIYKSLKQAKEQYASIVFPWKDYRSFESTQQVLKTIFHDLYQPKFTFSKPIHSYGRTNVIAITGAADGFILPTQCEPFFNALARIEAPLWIQSIELKRQEPWNAGFNLHLTFRAMSLSGTTAADATAAP